MPRFTSSPSWGSRVVKPHSTRGWTWNAREARTHTVPGVAATNPRWSGRGRGSEILQYRRSRSGAAPAQVVRAGPRQEIPELNDRGVFAVGHQFPQPPERAATTARRPG